MSAELPLPVGSVDARPYWQATRDGKLVYQRCSDCGAPRGYPRHLCPVCWSERAEWKEASGRGRVYTFTIIRRPPVPAFSARVPYVVALIDLPEGIRMMANVVGDDALDTAIGDEVAVTFESRGDDVALPQFRRGRP